MLLFTLAAPRSTSSLLPCFVQPHALPMLRGAAILCSLPAACFAKPKPLHPGACTGSRRATSKVAPVRASGVFVPAETVEAEIRVKNSRFIATIGHTPTVESARDFVAGVKERFPDARHHCYAFAVGHGASVTHGMSDDGEPSGTAGRPILAVVQVAPPPRLSPPQRRSTQPNKPNASDPPRVIRGGGGGGGGGGGDGDGGGPPPTGFLARRRHRRGHAVFWRHEARYGRPREGLHRVGTGGAHCPSHTAPGAGGGVCGCGQGACTRGPKLLEPLEPCALCSLPSAPPAPPRARRPRAAPRAGGAARHPDGGEGRAHEDARVQRHVQAVRRAKGPARGARGVRTTSAPCRCAPRRPSRRRARLRPCMCVTSLAFLDPFWRLGFLEPFWRLGFLEPFWSFGFLEAFWPTPRVRAAPRGGLGRGA
jgi:hypothetical protein